MLLISFSKHNFWIMNDCKKGNTIYCVISGYAAPSIQQTVMHPFIIASSDFFTSLGNSSFYVGSDQTGQPSLSMRINKFKVPMTPHQLSYFTRYYDTITETTYKTPPFWKCSDPVIYPSQFAFCQRCSDSYTCPFFLIPTPTPRTVCSLAA